MQVLSEKKYYTALWNFRDKYIYYQKAGKTIIKKNTEM